MFSICSFRNGTQNHFFLCSNVIQADFSGKSGILKLKILPSCVERIRIRKTAFPILYQLLRRYSAFCMNRIDTHIVEGNENTLPIWTFILPHTPFAAAVRNIVIFLKIFPRIEEFNVSDRNFAFLYSYSGFSALFGESIWTIKQRSSQSVGSVSGAFAR